MIQQIKNDAFLDQLFSYNSFEMAEIYNSSFSNDSCRVFSIKYNKTIIINKITFSQKYTIENFISDLKQNQKVELHENILKILAIAKQSINEVTFIHEYAIDGTLRQYLKQNFRNINWNDKLRLANQLISAIKCFHENDIVHTNLNSEKIFVHNGDIKVAFQYRNHNIDIVKYIPYIDPQYLQNIETYKLNKSSDIYSIGVLLWEISSGRVPFKTGLPYYDLLNIINGERETTIPGTPENYIKIYTECWQNDSNQRPIIQHIFKNLNDINYDDEMFIEYDNENRDQLMSGKENLNTTDLLIHYTNLYNETTKKLDLISSVITILNKNFNKIKLFENQINTLDLKSSSPTITNSFSHNDNSEQNFLCNLNQLFITQFNVQGVSDDTTSSIILFINKYMDDNNKNPDEILKQYCNNQYRYYYTSLIGFFYENGIGTIVDYSKAFDIYRQAVKDIYSSHIDSSLLKKNQLIGMILLGLLYINGKGVPVNHPKALQLFLKSAAKGSSLGNLYIGECYYHGCGIVKNNVYSFNWYLKSAEEGNASAKNMIGHCYYTGRGVSKNYSEALKWYAMSAIDGNCFAYNNLGYLYGNGLGTSKESERALKYYMISAEGGCIAGQTNLGLCYYLGHGTTRDTEKAFEWFSKSAGGGNSISQLYLGICYKYGVGIAKDKNKAFEWYMKSAEKGNSLAQNYVGVCYEDGTGTFIDKKKAFEWYYKSAAEGSYLGKTNLVRCYKDGIGTSKNETKVQELKELFNFL